MYGTHSWGVFSSLSPHSVGLATKEMGHIKHIGKLCRDLERVNKQRVRRTSSGAGKRGQRDGEAVRRQEPGTELD